MEAGVSQVSPQKEIIDIGDLLSQSWELYASKIKTFLAIMGIQIAVIALSLVVIIGIPLVLLAVKIGLDPKNFAKDPSALVILIVPVLLAVILVIVVAYISRLALLLAIFDEATSPLSTYFKSAFSLFWSYAWIAFLVGLVVGAGFLLLVIPGIIFLIWFTFSEFILVNEGLRGTGALSRSHELVRGRFWDVLIRIIIIAALAFSVNVAGGIVVSAVPVLSPLLNILSTLFVTPFITVAYYFVYRSLVETMPGDSAVS